jgi:dolichyl-phosphate-mannose--protein O-mannosyl transferase
MQGVVDGRSVNPATAPLRWAWWHPLIAVGVTVAGAVPRARHIGRPDGFSWDEAYYVPAARAYLDGDFTQNFEHPPLAKWAMAASIDLVGDEPFGWRLPALTAGIATIALTWLLVRRLLGSIGWATFAAALVAADGMLIAQSRTGILDSLLPPLIVGAALCIVTHLDRRERRDLSAWLVGAGVLLGAAVAVKWQAGTALLGVLTAFAIVARRDRRALVTTALAFGIVPFAVYLISYAGHFLDGLSLGEWLSMQKRMADYHRNFRVDHPRDSSPLTWLWLQRPPSYGSAHAPGRIAITMALGNPALWWAYCASVPLLVITWWRGRDRTVELVLFAWTALHLVWLIVLRPGFLYYLTPLVPFMAIGVTWSVRWVAHHWRVRGRRVGWGVPVLVGLAVAAAFVVWLPVWTYQDISESRFHRLMLFDGWEL